MGRGGRGRGGGEEGEREGRGRGRGRGEEGDNGRTTTRTACTGSRRSRHAGCHQSGALGGVRHRVRRTRPCSCGSVHHAAQQGHRSQLRLPVSPTARAKKPAIVTQLLALPSHDTVRLIAYNKNPNNNNNNNNNNMTALAPLLAPSQPAAPLPWSILWSWLCPNRKGLQLRLEVGNFVTREGESGSWRLDG